MPTYPYQQVADLLRARIRDGSYPPGAKLPSRTQLRAEHGVSDILIETLPGVGVYVADPLPPERP
jgi:GntR family transcriptional regulator